MSSLYTIVHKKHYCPMWKIDVSIAGKYHYFDETNPYKARYINCKCPILENLKLPTHKQLKEYGLFKFCKLEQECLSSIEFAPEIDTRLNY